MPAPAARLTLFLCAAAALLEGFDTEIESVLNEFGDHEEEAG